MARSRSKVGAQMSGSGGGGQWNRSGCWVGGGEQWIGSCTGSQRRFQVRGLRAVSETGSLHGQKTGESFHAQNRAVLAERLQRTAEQPVSIDKW